MDKLNSKKICEKAFQYEKEYGGCAQAVVRSFLDDMESNKDEIFKIATGFNGGFGLTGSVCGAFSGAVIILSYLTGREDFFDPERKRYITYKLTKKLIYKFNEEYGSIICKDIQEKIMGRSFDLWDEKQRKGFEEVGAHLDKCPNVCKNSAKWTIELLEDYIEL